MEKEKETADVIKLSRIDIEQQLNTFVGGLKVEGLSGETKVSLVKLKLELSKLCKEMDDYRKTTLESIEKPENYDDLKAAAEKEDATDEEKKAFEKAKVQYDIKFTEVAGDYFREVVELDFKGISEKDFYTIVKNNDVSVLFGYEYIYSLLVKK